MYSAIVSDHWPKFILHVWKAFLKLLSISVSLSSRYHPQTNGQTERNIQEIGRYLGAYCHDNQHSWNHFLPWAEYAQNSLWQITTGLTPFQCILGYQPTLFPWMEEPSVLHSSCGPLVPDKQEILGLSPYSPPAGSAEKQDLHRCPMVYRQGDQVWLSTWDVRLCLPCHKLSPAK